jgi:hypothetical protein
MTFTLVAFPRRVLHHASPIALANISIDSLYSPLLVAARGFQDQAIVTSFHLLIYYRDRVITTVRSPNTEKQKQ